MAQPVWTGSEWWFWKFLESCCRFYLPLSPYWQHLTETNENWQPTRAAIIQCRTGSPRMTSAWVIGQFLYAGSGISKALWIPVNQLNEPSTRFQLAWVRSLRLIQQTLFSEFNYTISTLIRLHKLFQIKSYFLHIGMTEKHPGNVVKFRKRFNAFNSTRSPKRYDRLLETTHDSWLRGSTVRCNCSQILNLGTTTREKWDQH